jgi:hypothetical protein
VVQGVTRWGRGSEGGVVCRDRLRLRSAIADLVGYGWGRAGLIRQLMVCIEHDVGCRWGRAGLIWY